MKIAFRVDASNEMGTGHFMRCLTLATELKSYGNRILFISRHLPDSFKKVLIEKGIEHSQLNSDAKGDCIDELVHSHWLGVSQANDAHGVSEILIGGLWDWIVVDHYALDERWESAVRENCKKLMVIDDLADRQHDCDVLIDQNFYAEMQLRYISKVPKYCQLLLGPRYVLLREEFRRLRYQVKPRMGEVRRILIFFGGVDVSNYTSLAMDALNEMSNQFHVDVVIGVQHPFREQIQHACIAKGFICHVQTERIAELMAQADLAIGAGGTATWERCALGLPTITLVLAENQRKLINDAAEAGLLYAPNSGLDLVKVIRDHVISLSENSSLIKLISNVAMNSVDGKGLMRVVAVMSNINIDIKRAGNIDLENTFKWRNNPKIRVASRNSNPISWEDHQKWFDTVLTNKNCELLIGERADEQVGVVRFDIDGNVAEVSIYLVPDASFKGQGRNLLTSAERWLKLNRADIKSIRARVLDGNKASKNLFLSLNYQATTIYYQKNLGDSDENCK